MTAEIVAIRPLKRIVVSYDAEGWHVRMGGLHQLFWKRHLAAGFIDLLLTRNVATVEIDGEVPDE